MVLSHRQPAIKQSTWKTDVLEAERSFDEHMEEAGQPSLTHVARIVAWLLKMWLRVASLTPSYIDLVYFGKCLR